MEKETGNTTGHREGNLEAPTRHPIAWRDPLFTDPAALDAELTRVFEICHGCRRCFNLCQAFPTLFDLIDNSPDMELAGVDHADYARVVDQCYLCDMCYMTKCPYVPPHAWNVDFPHLMLRAKAAKFRAGTTRLRDRVLTSTDAVGRLAGIPVVTQVVNAANRNRASRAVLQSVLGVDARARLPAYHSRTFRKGWQSAPRAPEPTPETTGQVILFATCYGNYNEPELAADLARVLEHNGIGVRLYDSERCCGMPKLEVGDLDSVAALKDANIPGLAALVDEGYDIVAPVPSCVLMFKQELPLLFPGDEAVAKVRKAMFDPFEYLLLRHKAGRMKTDFVHPLGKIAYHVPCHQRVQNIGLKTRDLLMMVPGTTVEVIERCSGHDGTYGVKREFYEDAVKIGAPVVTRIRDSDADHVMSDCPIAGYHLAQGLGPSVAPISRYALLRRAYGIE
ncbi:heterodisulfide reductase-related iron-sulfur binding cluster [Acidiferrobacter sp.]|uniref:heterodisulfide reductase-related iron-sulfur binding cluster n=1 Tax=Acidiferrobacter sp. TaxID=1872107 RepID=UPI002633116F|nr:heterodisulfide reductase-related iron-sulfur binding cluster [Acidiferrobacter sp.]